MSATMTTPEERRLFWQEYLGERRGTYEFRCQRYAAVAEIMRQRGLSDEHRVVDIGAGACEFGRYLRSTGWAGDYVPIDGSLDGTDIEKWTPTSSDWLIAIELLEHLYDPHRLIADMERYARRGAVITTPNPAVVDVLAIDRTHRTPLPSSVFHAAGWSVAVRSFFTKPGDSLLAWWLR